MNSFLQGKKFLQAPALTRPANPAVPPAPALCRPSHLPVPATGAAGPQVEVVKEGDKVVRLIVTCMCGERVEIECLYPAGA